MASTTPKVGSSEHTKLLNHINGLIRLSDRAKSNYIKQWDDAEVLFRGYVDTKKKDKEGKLFYPRPRDITIPITFAIAQTLLTYLMSVFTLKNPMVELWPKGGGDVALIRAKNMEADVDWQLRRDRAIAVLYLWFQDAIKYGIGIVSVAWKVETTEWERQVIVPTVGPDLSVGSRTTFEMVRESEEFNFLTNIDPYNLHRDPRVSVFDQNDGEFMGHRVWRHIDALRYDRYDHSTGQGLYANLGELAKSTPGRAGMMGTISPRRLEITGDTTNLDREMPSLGLPRQAGMKHHTIDEMEVWLVPSRLGLGTSSRREKWIVTVGDSKIIIRAERSPYPTNSFRYFQIAPYGDAYSVGQPGLPQLVDGLQRSMDWFMNSHMDNVRKSLNDMLLVDPSMVHMPDLDTPQAGRVIRLNRTYWGYPDAIKLAMKQFDVGDVTRGNVSDAVDFMGLMQKVTASSDIQMGMPTKQRKTLGEVQSILTQSASRLRLIAQLFSVNGIRPLIRQMIRNTQEFRSEAQYLKIVGKDNAQLVSPQDLQGDFDLPITDGMTPIDASYHINTWKEVLISVVQQPELAQVFDVAGIFRYLAKLTGAQNIDSFIRKPQQQVQQMPQQLMQGMNGIQGIGVAPDEEVLRGIESGNLAGLT